uniref:Uncharacterized protein n=1 Tax=Glossina austeni TaxID=7395 RepID=A0A1A9V070_GLOAU
MSGHCLSLIPVLYYDDLSPQARSCCMLIKVLDVDVELKYINLISGEHLGEAYSKINPSRTVPTLIDGPVTLYDGHTIMIYLCDKYASKYGPPVMPKDYLGRLEIFNFLFFEACVLHRCHSHLLTDILLHKYPNFAVDYHKGKIIDCYSALNSFLTDRTFLAGHCITIADFSAVTTLSALDLLLPINITYWPKLKVWFERLKMLPWYKVNADGIVKQREVLKIVGEFPFPSPLQQSTVLQRKFPFRCDVDYNEIFDKLPENKFGEHEKIEKHVHFKNCQHTTKCSLSQVATDFERNSSSLLSQGQCGDKNTTNVWYLKN